MHFFFLRANSVASCASQECLLSDSQFYKKISLTFMANSEIRVWFKCFKIRKLETEPGPYFKLYVVITKMAKGE
jgi:hypothetical protein